MLHYIFILTNNLFINPILKMIFMEDFRLWTSLGFLSICNGRKIQQFTRRQDLVIKISAVTESDIQKQQQ